MNNGTTTFQNYLTILTILKLLQYLKIYYVISIIFTLLKMGNFVAYYGFKKKQKIIIFN